MAPQNFFREVELPQQKSHGDGILFPAVLSPNPDTAQTTVNFFEEAIGAHKPWLESLLQTRGAILFRGFPVASPSDFNQVIEAFGFPEAPYFGGRACRTKVVGRVYTANETPPEKDIPFHHEMAYLPESPSKLFFFCEEEPGSGGETPLVLSHIIYEKMKERHPDFVAQLEEHGLTYIKVMGDEDDPSLVTGSSWKTAYKTEDKNIAVERAAKLGSKLEWVRNAAKSSTGPVAGIRCDEENNRKTWFNSLAVSYSGMMDDKVNQNTSVVFGNGEALPDHAMKDCCKILEEECVAIPWKRGDVLLVNNMMVLHGRRPLLKPPRRVLASLCK